MKKVEISNKMLLILFVFILIIIVGITLLIFK